MPGIAYASDVIPEALRANHVEELAGYAAAGDWLTGEERTAVVAHARAARAAAGLQAETPSPVAPAEVLPSAMLEVIAAIAVEPRTLDRGTWERSSAAGISDGEYAELVSLVARVVNMDVFLRGIGSDLHDLKAPQDGEPALERPPGATSEGAWIDSVPADASGGEVAAKIYGGNPMPFIYRAVSLAPGEAARIIAGGNLQYITLDRFFDFGYSHHAALTRAQVELVAGRVSAYNDCFY